MGEKIIQQTFWQKTKRFFEPLFIEKAVTLRSIILYSLWGTTVVIHIFFIQKIIFFLEEGNIFMFKKVIFIYIGLIIFYELSDYWMRKWGWVENVNAYRNWIDKKYVSRFLKIENTQIEKYGTGKLVSIITKGSDVWSLQLNQFLMEFFKLVFIFLYAIYVIFQLGVWYGISFIFIYVLIFSLSAYFNSQSLEFRRERIGEWNDYTKSYVRILMNKVEISNSGKGTYEINRLKNHAETITEINKKMSTSVFFCYRVGESSIIWLKILIIFFVGMGVFHGEYTLSFFVGIFAVFAFLETGIVSTTAFFRSFTKEFTTIENMWDFFDNTPQIQGYEEGNTFQHTTGAISLKNVNYGYNESKPVFQDFSLDIAGSKVTALVGASGGGKSTLVKLISGYIRQDSGDILVDDQNLKETSLKSYYADVGYLTQEPSVFDGTILENLMYAVNQDITHPQSFTLQEKEADNQTPLSDSLQTPSSQFFSLGGEDETAIIQKNAALLSSEGEEIQRGGGGLDHIIQLANCEFIYDLPNGLDTEIGERGVKLSGGQKQRLAIAKIFLKDPKIIILDEPTSALDSLSEQKITKAMHNLFKNRTVLVIAHRLQTVKHADDIIVIEGGEVRERGTHSELTKKKGFYKQMLDLQSGF